MKSVPHVDSGMIALARSLADEGRSVFTVSDAIQQAEASGVSRTYVPEGLGRLARAGWLTRLRRGLYAFGPKFPGVKPTHEWAIAMAIVKPAAISHWSAMLHHGLTDQLPRLTYVTTLKGRWVPRLDKGEPYLVRDQAFRFVQVVLSRFFGHSTDWVVDSKITVTDLERTLLDGLSRPDLCGGMGEVFAAFEEAGDRIDLDRAAGHVLKLDAAVAARLGWTLEHVLGLGNSDVIAALEALPMKGSRRLDASRPDGGHLDPRWHLRLNSSLVRGP